MGSVGPSEGPSVTLTSDDRPYPATCGATGHVPGDPALLQGREPVLRLLLQEAHLISLAKAAPTALRPFTCWPCGDHPLPCGSSLPELQALNSGSRPVLGPDGCSAVCGTRSEGSGTFFLSGPAESWTNTPAPAPFAIPGPVLCKASCLPLWRCSLRALRRGGCGVGCWSGLGPHLHAPLQPPNPAPQKGLEGALLPCRQMDARGRSLLLSL